MGYNAIEIDGEVKLDLSEDTVTEETLPEGVTAHDANGEPIQGKMKFVKSINGETGDVTLNASDVGAEDAGTVSTHNTNTESHNDIRLELTRLAGIINDVLDSDDVDLNELHEIVAYIKSNSALIAAITVSKVNVEDIINNLTTNVTDKPLSAAQGVELNKNKLDASKLTEAINTALAEAKASGEFDGEDGVGIDEVTINNYGELEITYTDGNSTNVGKVKGDDGVLTPEQEALLAAIPDLKGWYDKEHYQNMIGTFTATVADGTFLLGSVVESEFTWDFDKLPISISKGIVDEDAENEGLENINDPSKQGQISEEFTASTETVIEYKIKGVYAGPYGDEIAEKTWTYYFRNKRYWGMAEEPAKVNGAFITSLSKSEFATTQNKSFNLNDKSTDKYIWYCYPARFGTSVFTGNGLPGGFDYVGLVNDEESLKVLKENFYVYRSTEKGIGTADIVVKRG